MKPKINLEKTTLEHPPAEQLKWERELLGLYLSQHPLKAYETYLNELAVPIKELKAEMDNKTTVIGGAITVIREITTKSGQKMAFIKIADMTGETEIVLFPNVYQQTTGIWERDNVVIVRGKVSGRNRTDGELSSEIKILADEAREISPEQAAAYQSTGKQQKLPSIKVSGSPNTKESTGAADKRIYVRLLNSQDTELLTSLKETIDKFKGKTEVVLVLGDNDHKQIIKLPTGMQLDEDAISHLRVLVGDDRVVIQ